MGEYLLWLLAGTGLCLLFALLIRRRDAEARRIDERAEARRQAKVLAEEESPAVEHAEAERVAAEDRCEAAEQAERARIAGIEAEQEAKRLAAQQAASEAEAQRLAEQRAEEERLAVERAEAERVASAEQAERERIATLQAEREAQRLAQEQAARKAEAQRLAEEQRLAAERIERERLDALQAERDAQRRAAELAAREAQLQAEARRQAELRAEQERLAGERAEAERVAAMQRRAAKTAAQTLVLVADDSKVVRIKTGRLLTQHHYQVAYANDGLDAVQQMQARLPDVVITDVEMPGMDGFELTRQIRADPQTARLPVIMITAADDRHRGEADGAGVSVLLGKPYPDDVLISHIRSAMGQDAAAAAAVATSTHGALDALA